MDKKNVKIVWIDNKQTKTLFGCLEKEDSDFFYILTENGTRFIIGKKSVISMKEWGSI